MGRRGGCSRQITGAIALGVERIGAWGAGVGYGFGLALSGAGARNRRYGAQHGGAIYGHFAAFYWSGDSFLSPGVRYRPGQCAEKKWWGLLWPWSRHVFGLGQFDKVTLRQEPRQLGSRRKPKLITEYPVRLEGEKRLLVRGDLPEDKARALAREIADYLDLPLESTLPEETEEDKAQ